MKLISHLQSLVLLLSVSIAAARDKDSNLWKDTSPTLIGQQHLLSSITALPFKSAKSPVFTNRLLPWWTTNHVAKLDGNSVQLRKEQDIIEAHSFTVFAGQGQGAVLASDKYSASATLAQGHGEYTTASLF